MTAPWIVYIRDPQYRRVAQLEDYTVLDLNLKFNDVSVWSLTLSARSDWASTLAQDGYGISVYRGDVAVLSGQWSKTRTQWDDSTDTITFSGDDDTAWMKYRLAHPQPAIADSGATFATVLEDLGPLAGTASAASLIRYFAARNLGVDSQLNRRVANSHSGPTYGQQMVKRARWQNLLTFCQETAAAGAVNGIEPGFRLVQLPGGLDVQTYTPVDRTATVKFSPALGNVERLTYERTAPEATFVYAGNGGDDTARQYRASGNNALIAVWGRREAELVNASSAVTDAELDAEIAKTLNEKGPKTSLSLTPLDTDTLQYGVHYALGDRVSAVLNRLGPGNQLQPGDVVQDVIRECRINVTAEGTEITPTVGSSGTGLNLTKIFSRVRNLTSRLTNIETRG